MTQPRSAPMPASLRPNRPAPHPALAERCPHCAAAVGIRCTTRTGRARTIRLDPCQARIDRYLDAHAIATAVCTTCQVAPGTPCHRDGRPVPVHPARHQEAGNAA